jgi:hypothetical protein
MTAPGKNLEFEQLEDFSRRCASIPGLKERVREEIENRPNLAAPIVGPIRKVEVVYQGGIFVAYFGRSTNKIGLMRIFKGHLEKKLQVEYEEELRKRYSGDGR